jgi:hypothetical protein
MRAPLKLSVVALCGGLAVLGIALGAESQREVFLEPDLSALDQANQDEAAGNLVALTAAIVAFAAAFAAAQLSRRRGLRRAGAATAVFAAAYTAVFVAQTSWPNYNYPQDRSFADLANSLLAANVPAVPSLLLPVFALLLAALLLGGLALRRLLAPDPAPASPRTLLARQCAATLLAVPFLVIAAFGSLRLLLRLPDDQPGLGPYLAVLPTAALLCLGLAAAALAKCWRLGMYVRNGRLAALVQESWQALGRAEAALAGALALLAVLSTALPAADLSDLNLGRAFGVTLRGHMQLLVLLGVPLAPGLLLQRRVLAYLERAPAHSATLESGTDPLALATLAGSVLSAALAAATTWSDAGALWAWLAVLLPAAAVAFARLGGWRSAPTTLLAAFALWAIGNTVVAHYESGDEAILQFRDPPGVLALWRTLGAALAGAAAARLALLAGRRERVAVAVPAAVGAGACLAALALMEMPLAAWLLNRGGGEAIAVGSLLASQDPPVRILLHSLAGLCGVAAALLLARVHRPEWFQPPPPPPLQAPVRRKSPSSRPPRPVPKSA